MDKNIKNKVPNPKYPDNFQNNSDKLKDDVQCKNQ